MKGYDEWKLHNPNDDEKVFCSCEHCSGEIYMGEEYLEIDGCNIHDNCFLEYVEESLNPIRKVAGE